MQMQNFNLQSYNCDVFYHKTWTDFLTEISNSGIHEVRESSNPYHILIDGLSRDNNYILVGFSGAVSNRSKTIPPYFSFRNVAIKADIGLIAFSDPSLNLHNELNLAWYAQNHINGNIAEKIASILDEIVFRTGKKLILAGGSGGGFAALNIHAKMKLAKMAKAFVWNPQTDITKYLEFFVKRYYSHAFNKESTVTLSEVEKYFIENEIPFHVEKNIGLEQLVFINGYDPGHIRKHVRKLTNSYQPDDQNRIFMGNWGNGHVQPPNHIIVSVINSISKGLGFDQIISLMPQEKKECLNIGRHQKFLVEKLFANVILIDGLENETLAIIRCNLFDIFMGYNIRYKITFNGKILFHSDYLPGESRAEQIFKIKIGHMEDFLASELHIYIEDIYGASINHKFLVNQILYRQSINPNTLIF